MKSSEAVQRVTVVLCTMPAQRRGAAGVFRVRGLSFQVVFFGMRLANNSQIIYYVLKDILFQYSADARLYNRDIFCIVHLHLLFRGEKGRRVAKRETLVAKRFHWPPFGRTCKRRRTCDRSCASGDYPSLFCLMIQDIM